MPIVMDLPRGVQYHSRSLDPLRFGLDIGPPAPDFKPTVDDAISLPGPFVRAAAAALAEAGLADPAVTVLVSEVAWIAPLKRALFGRVAGPGRAWLPPVVETVDALAARCLPVARVRSREGRLLALAAALSSDGQAGWSARLQRAGDLLDPIDAIARTRVCDWLAVGAPGEVPTWDEDAVLERIGRMAEAAGPGLIGVLAAEWRTIARLGRWVSTDEDPVQVAARQWQALLSTWREQPPRLVRVGQWPLGTMPSSTDARSAVSDPFECSGEPGSDVLRSLLAALPDVRLVDACPDRASLAGGTAERYLRAWPEVAAPGERAGETGQREPVGPPIRERRLSPASGQDAVAATILHALDREDESMRAAAWVHRMLAAGARSVGIVVLDRWLARRTRALLERATVLIDDREGWALSTTVAATWPMAWLDLCAFDPVDGALPVHGQAWIALASLLDSAFTRHPDGPAFAAMLRRRALGDTVVAPPALAALEAALLDRIRDQRLAHSAREQAACLRRAMAVLGADRTMPADEAGRQVLAMIDRLGAPVEPVRRRCDHEAFRALLGFFLERQRFHDTAIRSPVKMTGLAATAVQSFDAVLVLGANAGQLPTAQAPVPGMVDALLPGVGLVPAAVAVQDQLFALTCLLASTPQVAITCRSDPDDGTLPSPLVVRLAAIAGLDLRAVGAEGAIARRLVAPLPGRSDHFPMPRPAEPASLPATLSVSAIDRLVQCPFRFLVADVWGLGEAREREEEPGKRELGIVVHAVLARFHRDIEDPGQFDDPTLVARLAELTRSVLAERPMLHAPRLVQLREWAALLPDYVRAFRADHAEGWRFQAAEQRVEQRIAVSADREVRIIGTYDRLDRRAADPGSTRGHAVGEAEGMVGRVVDYKLRSLTQVSRLADDPDSAAQLMLYAWFTGAEQAAYVAIERRQVTARALKPPPVDSLPHWRARLTDVLGRIADGEPMRSLGDACEYCDARGVCRQGHWRDEAGELASGHVAGGPGMSGRAASGPAASDQPPASAAEHHP